MMQKPPIIASLFMLLSLSILLTLGTWQFQKYWILTQDIKNCPDGKNARFQKDFHVLHKKFGNRCFVTLTGVALEFPIIPVIQWGEDAQSKAYQIYAYFMGADGSRILTNFGVSNIVDPKLNMGDIEVTGILYKPSEPNRFGPKNNPQQNKWYVLNLSQIKEHFKIKDSVAMRSSDQVLIAQNIVGLDGQKIDQFIPAVRHKSYLQPETHLQYSLFWYVMAFAMVCIFVLRFCRKV